MYKQSTLQTRTSLFQTYLPIGLFFRANVKVLIDFCAYGTAKRKTLVIIVKFYENILLEKRHVRVQRKYFFKTFSEIKHYVIVNDIEGLTTTFKKT